MKKIWIFVIMVFLFSGMELFAGDKGLDSLFKTDKPADVYLAAQASQAADESVDDDVKEFKKKGWGAAAQEKGIEPGSKEFHDLKKGDSERLRKREKNQDDDDDDDDDDGKERKKKRKQSKSKKRGKNK